MDESHRQLQKVKIVLPKRCDPLNVFAEHCHNVAKTLEEKDDGTVRYIYVKLGPDHYRHAFNYECIARGMGADSYFGSSDLS